MAPFFPIALVISSLVFKISIDEGEIWFSSVDFNFAASIIFSMWRDSSLAGIEEGFSSSIFFIVLSEYAKRSPPLNFGSKKRIREAN